MSTNFDNDSKPEMMVGQESNQSTDTMTTVEPMPKDMSTETDTVVADTNVPVEKVVDTFEDVMLTDEDTALTVKTAITLKAGELVALKRKLKAVYYRNNKLKGVKKQNAPKKKEAKVRPPGTKRRVLSAYNCYVKANAGKTPLKELAEAWKTMTDDDKQQYKNMSETDSKKADEELAAELANAPELANPASVD